MLSQAKRMWPHEVTANLWPYALRMGNDSINATPNLSDEQRHSPDQPFSGSEVATNPKHWKHFGCPVFVLDAALRSTARIHHKWKERSQLGIYLGRSPNHARSVALVLNPETGLVSPQFHIKFDSSFDTIKQLYGPASNHQSQWQLKAGLVMDKPTAKEKQKESAKARKEYKEVHEHVTKNTEKTGPTSERDGRDDQPQEMNDVAPTEKKAATEGRPGEHSLARHPNMDNTTVAQQRRTPLRRSARERRGVQRLIEAMVTEVEQDTNSSGEIFSYQAMFPHDDDSDNIHDDIYAMKAKADPDTLYLHKAHEQPDWEEFAEAMEMKIEQQILHGVYSLCKRSEVPE